MNLYTFLRKQFEDFIEVYYKYSLRTSAVALTYTLLCFLIIALLLRFSDFDHLTTKKQFSLLSYFFSRYSKGEIYSIVDLSKTVFIFFVSIFSIGLTRINLSGQEKTEFRVIDFLKRIYFNDLLYLLSIGALCCILDYLLFQIDRLSLLTVSNSALDQYIHGIIFLLRIYFPLMLFALTNYRIIANKWLKLSFSKLLLLFISLWFFNEFAYEFSLVVRSHLLGLILIPFGLEKQFFIESFFGIFLVAFYFVGFHSAMSTSLKLIENPKN